MNKRDGLMHFNPDKNVFKNYLPENGIPYEEFNQFAHAKLSNGWLAFGGLNGLTVFDPNVVTSQSQRDIPLKIVGWRVLGDTVVHAGHEVSLQPNQRSISIELAYLDFTQSEHIYAVRSDYLKDDWIYTQNNPITFARIPYGEHTIEIKARGGEKSWNENPLQVKVHVLKPFYLRLPFILTTLFSFILLLFLAYRYRINQLNKNRLRLEAEVLIRTKQIEQDRQLILQQANELKALDDMKNKLFSNITHDFRTPLTLILGPIEQLIKEPIPFDILKRRLKVIQSNARRLLVLINQLLDLAKLESKEMDGHIIEDDIWSFTKELIKPHKMVAQSKGLEINLNQPENKMFVVYDDIKWSKIVSNLITNAIKYTETGGKIDVKLERKSDSGMSWIHLIICDTGKGISKENQTKIFERFYQIESTENLAHVGTGIGLAIVKELVKIQNGEILLESKVNQGSTFHIKIPEYTKTQITHQTRAMDHIGQSASIPQTESFTDEPITNVEDRDQILVVDDHSQMRDYIVQCLDSKKYNVYTAGDGNDAFIQASTRVPDLIVSDVKMPNKDGFELIRNLRETVITSHIPVILLTAHPSEESKIEGLKIGADAYLAKPFSPDELNARIFNLIENRRLLQKIYQDSNTTTTSKDPPVALDGFVLKLREFVLNHLDEQKLNGDVLGHEFGISRVHLHRKLKALTGQSISSFVKDIRLKEAYKLIHDSDYNVSETADMTGFSSISYFSRVFKEKFGEAPSRMLHGDK